MSYDNQQTIYQQQQNTPPQYPNTMNLTQSPISPYTNSSATPTTSHQVSQLKYQQQQQQNYSINLQQHYHSSSNRSPPSPFDKSSISCINTSKYLNATPTESVTSNHISPCSQRSRVSPIFGSEFPDTLPVLDENNNKSENIPFSLVNDDDLDDAESNNSKESDQESMADLFDGEFLKELSQIALDETISNQTADEMEADIKLLDISSNLMSEIDEQMEQENSDNDDDDEEEKQSPSPIKSASKLAQIGRSFSHRSALKINMKAPSIDRLSPPRITMPNANNMISPSSNQNTPITPQRNVLYHPYSAFANTTSQTPMPRHSHSANQRQQQQQRQYHQIAQTPNSYQYRQQRASYDSYQRQKQQQQQQQQQSHSTASYHHQLSSLYTSQSHNGHHSNYNLMGSQTPGPNMSGSRMRSKSATLSTSYAQSNGHGGSMTPQVHSRRHTVHHHAQQQQYAMSRTEKIYKLLQSNGGSMKLSHFTRAYPMHFNELLPSHNGNSNALLKYLVQCARILVIKCLHEEDIMIFYCESSSHRTVIDILRRNEEENGGINNANYAGMEIKEFTQRLAEKLKLRNLSNCNMIDFLTRWRVVELTQNNEYVRLMPMGSCTVFLGNLNPSQWNEQKVRNVLTQINASWYNLRIRLNQTNYGLLNAFVDFANMRQAQSAIGLIKNHLHLFENNNQSHQQQQQQQQMAVYHHQQQQMQIMQQQKQQKLAQQQQQNNNIRVEIEQSSAHKKTSYHHHQQQSGCVNTSNAQQTPSSNSNHNVNFNQITSNIYKLIRAKGGKMRMSAICKEYYKMFNCELQFDGNPKYFVKMERLLLLNCEEGDDVMIFFTPEPAYKLVVSILKQNPSGLSVNDFKQDLERRMSHSLAGCDFNDFLMRWRFLSIRETAQSKEKMVLFTPHSGSTVFFGNLNIECTENDIYNDLEAADSAWRHSSVRLKLGKGFAYAFVDFPTRSDAIKAVKHFDGTSAFKSKYVSADIEAIEQRKKHCPKTPNRRNRSYSHGHNATPSIPRHRNMLRSDHQSNNGQRVNNNKKTTVYLGNLRDDVTKSNILSELHKFESSWSHLVIRLNLRSGWSHAFVDFECAQNARKLINAWNNAPNALTATRLRCEISKRQM